MIINYIKNHLKISICFIIILICFLLFILLWNNKIGHELYAYGKTANISISNFNSYRNLQVKNFLCSININNKESIAFVEYKDNSFGFYYIKKQWNNSYKVEGWRREISNQIINGIPIFLSWCNLNNSDSLGIYYGYIKVSQVNKITVDGHSPNVVKTKYGIVWYRLNTSQTAIIHYYNGNKLIF